MEKLVGDTAGNFYGYSVEFMYRDRREADLTASCTNDFLYSVICVKRNMYLGRM